MTVDAAGRPHWPLEPENGQQDCAPSTTNVLFLKLVASNFDLFVGALPCRTLRFMVDVVALYKAQKWWHARILLYAHLNRNRVASDFERDQHEDGYRLGLPCALDLVLSCLIGGRSSTGSPPPVFGLHVDKLCGGCGFETTTGEPAPALFFASAVRAIQQNNALVSCGELVASVLGGAVAGPEHDAHLMQQQRNDEALARRLAPSSDMTSSTNYYNKIHLPLIT